MSPICSCVVNSLLGRWRGKRLRWIITWNLRMNCPLLGNGRSYNRIRARTVIHRRLLLLLLLLLLRLFWCWVCGIRTLASFIRTRGCRRRVIVARHIVDLSRIRHFFNEDAVAEKLSENDFWGKIYVMGDSLVPRCTALLV